MAVLDRSELEASPLADLHAIADQIGLDGFRRLRKADLIDAILGETPADGASAEDGPGEDKPKARRRRTPRLRRGKDSEGEDDDSGEDSPEEEVEASSA